LDGGVVWADARRCPGGLGDGLVTVFPPMGLDKHAVDLLEIDDAGLIADGLDEGAQAEVTGAAQESFTGTKCGGCG
jgi:hypothetical protein